MEAISISEIIRWTGGTPAGDNLEAELTGVSTDSRTVTPGELFVPLAGENFDGHNYVRTALERGAKAFLTHREPPEDCRDKGILVRDTQAAFQDIARNYLKKFKIPVVAITGSNDKTSTKDMTAHILSQKYRVVKTEKNFNNEIGVPKTVLQVDSSTEVLVVELAMRGPGQIREIARIVSPDISVITNIGESHFELLGSLEAIAKAKAEILEYLNPQGYAVLNADDNRYPWLVERAPARIVSFGLENRADVLLLKKEDRGLKGFDLIISLDGQIVSLHLPLLGIHNIYNTLAAVAIARCLRLSIPEIVNGVSTLTPPDKRMEILKAPGGWTALNDSYNASPTSMAKALEILKSLPISGRRIAALGDMLELGGIAVESHREIGKLAHRNGINYLFVKGGLGREIAVGALEDGMPGNRVIECRDTGNMIDRIGKVISPGDVILVKGSRLMKMEEVTAGLMAIETMATDAA